VTAASPSERFPRAHHVRKRREFLAIQREGHRRSTPHFVVIVRDRSTPPSRLGITTSRKVGNAPSRNRVRRLVREFFRRRQHALVPPRDVIVIARPAAAGLSYHELQRELSHALHLDVTAA
jgi:ribonuclease P protein component